MMSLGRPQIRRMNQGLVIVEILLIGATLGVGARALTQRPQLATTPRAVAAPATRPAAATSAPPLSWYAPIWTRDLRQPPVEPKPLPVAEVNKAPAAPPPLKVKLLGTVVEPEDRYGLFLDENGKIALKRLNERIGQYDVIEVERGKAQIKGPAGSVWLTMPDYDSRIQGD